MGQLLAPPCAAGWPMSAPSASLEEVLSLFVLCHIRSGATAAPLHLEELPLSIFEPMASSASLRDGAPHLLALVNLPVHRLAGQHPARLVSLGQAAR
eukprot:5672289-Alexandrium_andersonii.AAC.1